MNILITNDDGFYSEYTQKLAAKLLNNGENVTVIAPDKNRSGVSHSVSFYKKIYVREEESAYGVKTYSVTGTPADCVKFAHHAMTDVKFDLIISGVNDDLNVGADVYYSGTVGAAMQGVILGYPSIAVSVDRKYPYFDQILDFTVDLIYKLYATGFITAWNVNIPNIPIENIKGVRYARVACNRYKDYYVLGDEPNEYILSGDILKNKHIGTDSDVGYLDEGYVTVSPLTTERSDLNIIEKMNLTNQKDEIDALNAIGGLKRTE